MCTIHIQFGNLAKHMNNAADSAVSNGVRTLEAVGQVLDCATA